MVEKSRLLQIADLKLAGKIEKMNGNQLEVYAYNLDSFVEIFPEMDGKIKSALEAKDYGALSGHIELVCEMLKNIYADGLAKDCLQQTGGLKNQPHEKIEAYLTFFLSAVSALSIDIQMAKYKEGETVAPGTLKGGQRVILAVDDAAFFLNTLKSFLQETAYKLVCVTSAEAAMRFLESGKPDLFILDIEMPGTNGYELIRMIREAGQTAPAVFLTGNATKEYVVKAIKAGAADFLVKPAHKEQVLSRIKKFL